jgi:hypothetical protein
MLPEVSIATSKPAMDSPGVWKNMVVNSADRVHAHISTLVTKILSAKRQLFITIISGSIFFAEQMDEV